VNDKVKMLKKMDAVTALRRDAVFVCFVVAIVASSASEYGLSWDVGLYVLSMQRSII